MSDRIEQADTDSRKVPDYFNRIWWDSLPFREEGVANVKPVEWSNFYGDKRYQPNIDGKRLWTSKNGRQIPPLARKHWLSRDAAYLHFNPVLYRSRGRAIRKAERQLRRDNHRIKKHIVEVEK